MIHKWGHMKQLFIAVSILLLSASMHAPAKAYVEDGTKIDQRLVRQLMSYVEQQTGVRVATMPNVIASRKKFDLVMRFAGVSYGDARSLYIPGTVIMDNESWDPADTKQLSLLVHELVHHAQLFSKRRYPCPDAREVDSYTVQNKWLASQGEAPFASQDWISQMSSCGGSSLGIS